MNVPLPREKKKKVQGKVDAIIIILSPFILPRPAPGLLRRLKEEKTEFELGNCPWD